MCELFRSKTLALPRLIPFPKGKMMTEVSSLNCVGRLGSRLGPLVFFRPEANFGGRGRPASDDRKTPHTYKAKKAELVVKRTQAHYGPGLDPIGLNEPAEPESDRGPTVTVTTALLGVYFLLRSYLGGSGPTLEYSLAVRKMLYTYALAKIFIAALLRAWVCAGRVCSVT